MHAMKFEGHEKAQAQVLYYDDNSMALRSYSTIVATVDSEGWLHVNGLYSPTTIKHLGWFARMLNTSYHTMKTLLLDNKDMNLVTGEVRDWE